MDMTEQQFIQYVQKFGDFQKRSMFGGTGLFRDEAMFALISTDKIFIRGGEALDETLNQLGCEKYRHVKKQTTATVNYYDITQLFSSQHQRLSELVEQSINFSVSQREFKRSSANRRLRDLPNMQLTLERMVKKAGVEDVDTFLELGAPAVFSRVKQAYGSDVDVKLLWKFAGAIEGIHWKLIQEPRKRQLLASCH
ncbi:TfoX/Sxy family DNA transformation protein [Vibrio europaeus]|uniref:DNA transformation protein n=1 Tax=Vibrio europaeus TaxID=300876 RepID=A0A178JFT0_9VIBR|nr:TfoX/Sxy family DNA transformation protein [Vibrio europaeus]MDC5707064.1 TfoX/Sxy family DNA transformation protein [Vibrio europaeus]MDC5712429.1 TfoX/Sxy family DNA transformation protein [Vibrio europaeus]MDC5717072.1 TfoX/Sxy family DNA transformation protein [Vibrio europaeus]MDC5721394.1 TfoX/Sxy family DNA transformation protein [Vibrio europaeus]MDC5726372.1 TfoX/Sxy family DNA transformation protein [Vibrio europaeus]